MVCVSLAEMATSVVVVESSMLVLNCQIATAVRSGVYGVPNVIPRMRGNVCSAKIALA